MANLVTLVRFFLLIILCYMLLSKSLAVLIWAYLVGTIMYLMDILDGYVARKFNCASPLGSMFDVTVDRITEISIFVVFTYLHLVPLWLPILFIVRGSFTDMIRNYLLSQNISALSFNTLKSRWLTAIVDNSTIRWVYATLKGFFTAYLLAMLIYAIHYTSIYHAHHALFIGIRDVFMYVIVIINIARALPVFIDFYLYVRNTKEMRG
jgi:phosphatidylglycerophosphate synthase